MVVLPLDLVDYDKKVKIAVKHFWNTREEARQRQISTGKIDQGERSGVTRGKNLDAFINLFADVVKANGLADADICQNGKPLTLPGFFRPTKLWDLLVIHEGELVAAIELKSQAGPSFGNNFNNRAEEAIGTAHDFWTAFKEGAFRRQLRPFLGWLMLIEETGRSTSPVRDKSPHFPIFPEFESASYIKRYDLLCGKLIKEQLYTAATLIATRRETGRTEGAYSSISQGSDIKSFIASLAGYIAIAATRS
jgi:hypothetical protein